MGVVTDRAEQAAPPPPGPLAVVDMNEPRAAAVLQQVRQRLATWGDQALAMQRAVEAAETASRLLQAGAMGGAMQASGVGACVVHELPQDRPLWIVGDTRGDARWAGIPTCATTNPHAPANTTACSPQCRQTAERGQPPGWQRQTHGQTGERQP